MAETRTPFSRLSREVLFENPWHRYCRDRYVQTDGSTGEYFYIDMRGACTVVPQFANGDLLLIQCHRYLLGRALWEFPIGGIDPGESALQTAQKELEQETGYRAERWQLLGEFAPYKGVSNETTHVFLARDLEATEQVLEASEQITAHRLSPTTARQRLFEQDVLDGQSLVAWMLYEQWQAKNRPANEEPA